MSLLRFERPITPIEPDVIFSIGGFHIGNTTLYLYFIALVLLIALLVAQKKWKVSPKNGQTFVEFIYEGLLGLVTQIVGNEKRAEKIIPLLGSLFIYIGIANFSGLIPGLTSITFDGTSIFRTPTTDFNTTFGLALGSIIVLHITSIRDWGLFGHIGKFFKFKEVFLGFKKSAGAGGIALVEFFIGLLDIVGEFAKVISLSLRLFGNMYAGEVLMAILIGALAYGVPAIWFAMSILSATVQMIVFGSLVTVFYMLSLNPDKKEA